MSDLTLMHYSEQPVTLDRAYDYSTTRSGGRRVPRLDKPAIGVPRPVPSSSRPGVSAPGRRTEDDRNLVAFQPQAAGDASATLSAGPTSPCLSDGQIAGIQSGTTVRRLTPLECERLQGHPDGWTEGQSDAQRYKQMGNGVAVPVFEWVGRRLAAIDAQTLGCAA